MPQSPNTPSNGGGIDPNLIEAAADLARGYSATRVAVNALSNSMQDKLLGPTSLFAGSLVGSLAVLKSIVDQTGVLRRGLQQIAEMQGIQGKFETLLRSVSLAKKRIQELYQFAANSPFRLGDVAEANRVLQSLTFGAMAGRRGMQIVGDAAAATGTSMSDMAEKVGKAYNALQSGRSMDRIVFQMQMTGLVTDQMASKLEALDQVGAGFAEKWAVIETALRRTSGGMRNEMGNLDALATKLENTAAARDRAFSQSFVEAKGRAIEVKIKANENLTPVLEQIGRDVAPVLNAAGQFKTSIAESTLATKGFASVLSGAWVAARTLFGTLALATAGNFLKNFIPVTSKTWAFGKSTLGNARGMIAESKLPGGALAGAAEKWGSAKEALAGGQGIRVAASFALEAATAQIATRTMILHATAMRAVGDATGLVAVRNYLAAASTTVLGGAATLAGRALKFMAVSAKASFIALAVNPITWVAAAVVGTYTLVRAINDVEKAYKDLNIQLTDTRRKLREQAQAANSEQAWAANVQSYTEELQRASEALDAFQKKRRDQWFDRPLDDATETDLKTQVSQIRYSRYQAIMNRGNVGLTDRERDAYRADIENDRNQSSQAFQQAYDRADGEMQNRLIRERLALLEREAEIGERVRKAQTEFDRSASGKKAAAMEAELADQFNKVDYARRQKEESNNAPEKVAAYKAALERQKKTEQEIAEIRRNSGDAFTRNMQAQLDLQERMRAKPGALGKDDERATRLRELQREAMRLNSLVQNSATNRQEISELRNKLQLAQKAQALKAEELKWDERIANARRLGFETGSLDAGKRVAILRMQREQARAAGRPEEGAAAKLEMDQLNAERAEFRRSSNLERARNRALLAGNGQEVQAIDDYRARNAMIEEYTRNGMSADQAKRDFELSVRARNPEVPRISVDALQAVGGGGFSANPNNDYPRRQVALTERMVSYLEIIARKGDSAGTID